jgi:hypothetical protein
MSGAQKHFDSDAGHGWERGWEEHERLQLKRMARLPLSEKLAWLEEAHELVTRLKSTRSAG